MSDTTLRNAAIDPALAEAREAYVARNPKSLARTVEATAVMPGGNTRTVLHYDPFPLGFTRGQGCRLWDLDGAEYVDFLGEYTAGLYGHSHPVIRAAIDKRAGRRHQPGRPHGRPRRASPAPSARASPRSSGCASPTPAPRRTCWRSASPAHFTKRPKVMVFEGGYHGGVFTFSGGGSPINAPFEFVLAPYNDTADDRRADRAARRRPRRRGAGADDGRRRLHRRRACVPPRAACRDTRASARCCCSTR